MPVGFTPNSHPRECHATESAKHHFHRRPLSLASRLSGVNAREFLALFFDIFPGYKLPQNQNTQGDGQQQDQADHAMFVLQIERRQR